MTNVLDGAAPELASNQAALASARARVAELEAQLRAMIAVEQARGILRERLHVGLDAALELLRDSAADAGVATADLASAVVASRATPAAITARLAANRDWLRAHLQEEPERRRTSAAAPQRADRPR